MKSIYKTILILLTLIIIATLNTGCFFSNNSSSDNTNQGTYNNNSYYIIQFPDNKNIRDLFEVSVVPDFTVGYSTNFLNGDTTIYCVSGYNLKSGNSIVACKEKQVFIYYEGELTKYVFDGIMSKIFNTDEKNILPYSVGEKYFKDDLK